MKLEQAGREFRVGKYYYSSSQSWEVEYTLEDDMRSYILHIQVTSPIYRTRSYIPQNVGVLLTVP